MTTKTLDFEAARADLRGKIVTNDADAARLEEALGELALAASLGEAPDRELEANRKLRAERVATAAELRAALVAVDAREAVHTAAVAEKQRKADERRLAELTATCNAAGAQVVEMAAKLGDVIAEGRAASTEANRLGRVLDVSTVVIARWPFTAQGVINGRGLRSYMPPGELEAAERSLAGRQ